MPQIVQKEIINASDKNNNCEYISEGRFVLTIYCVVCGKKCESDQLLNYVIVQWLIAGLSTCEAWVQSIINLCGILS